jgi:hypothetical protein
MLHSQEVTKASQKYSLKTARTDGCTVHDVAVTQIQLSFVQTEKSLPAAEFCTHRSGCWNADLTSLSQGSEKHDR